MSHVSPRDWTIPSKLRMSEQFKERSREEGKNIRGEGIHSLESLYTAGAGDWEPGREWKKTKHFPNCGKLNQNLVKTKFCTWYRVGLDNMLFEQLYVIQGPISKCIIFIFLH